MHFGFTPLYGMVVRFFNAVDRMRVGGYAGHNWVGANSLFFLAPSHQPNFPRAIHRRRYKWYPKQQLEGKFANVM